MPIYEYRCEKCSSRFEVLTSFAERDSAQVCPSCESTRTRVQVSSFASLGRSEGPMEAAGSGGGGCSCGGSCACGSAN